MYQMLKPGQQLTTEFTRGRVTVDRFLGAGGQGEVYAVDWEGRPHALKWYFPHTATQEQAKRLQDLVQGGPPDAGRFLWPLEMVSDLSGGDSQLGYLMPLRPAEYRDVNDLMAGRCDPTFAVLLRAGANLVEGFRKLHAKGYCYCDISFANAFFDAASGAALICDNDNVVADNTPDVAVFGTARFMAPEIVLGQARPSRTTDLHSLAVLLFYILHMGHPLIGRRVLNIRILDQPALQRLCGSNRCSSLTNATPRTRRFPRARTARAKPATGRGSIGGFTPSQSARRSRGRSPAA